MKKPLILKITILSLISVLIVSAIGFTGYYYLKYSAFAGNKEVVDFKGLSRKEIEQYLTDNSIKSDYVVFEEVFDEEVEEGYVVSQSIPAGDGKFKEILKVFISKGFDPDLQVELPDYKDMMQDDIMEWFETNHFSNILFEFIEPEDDNVPYGKVIGLSIEGIAKRSDEITVLLADEKAVEENESDTVEESEYVKIIDFKGYSLNEFIKWVHDRGLKYYVYEVYSDDYKKGELISQSPKAGAEAKPGSTVTLRMSLGPAQKLDNLVGLSKTEVETYAKENKLNLKFVEDYSRTIEKGKVISTNPAAGKNVAEGDTVTVTISKGSDIIKLDSSYVNKKESELTSAVLNAYASAKFTKTQRYSDISSGYIISHDSEISLLNSFSYTVSLGQYSDSNNYAGKYLTDLQSVVNDANSKGAGVSIASPVYETTRDSSLNNKIKSVSLNNKVYSVTIYKYEEAETAFIPSDFAKMSEGSNTYTKDGNTFNITIKVTYTDYNNEVKDTFNSASCSTGNVVKNGSVITVVLNKGPKPVEYGGSIETIHYIMCEIPGDNDNPTMDKVKSAVISVLTNSLNYRQSQIQFVPTDSFKVGLIDVDSSTKGVKTLDDTIYVYIGSAPRGE